MDGMIQQLQGGGPQRSQDRAQGGGTYPANQEEVQQFIADLMNALYSEGQVEKVLQMLQQGGENLPQTIGSIAGSLAMSVVQRRGQQTGRKPHINLVIRGLQLVIKNIAELMKTAGIAEVDQKTLQEASMVAGRMVESAMGGGQQQPQQAPPPTPQSQGMMGGLQRG